MYNTFIRNLSIQMKVAHVNSHHCRTTNFNKMLNKKRPRTFKKLKSKNKLELTELDKVTVLLAFTFL